MRWKYLSGLVSACFSSSVLAGVTHYQGPFQKNVFHALCRQKLSSHFGTPEQVYVLKNDVSVVQPDSALSDLTTAITFTHASHLVIERERIPLGTIPGAVFEVYTPKIKFGMNPALQAEFEKHVAPYHRQFPLETRMGLVDPWTQIHLVKEWNQRDHDAYTQEVKTFTLFGTHEMEVRRGFTDTAALREAASLYHRRAINYVVKDADGNPMATLRRVDAPYGVDQRYTPKLQTFTGNFGPACARISMSALDYRNYVHGLHLLNTKHGNPPLMEAGFTPELIELESDQVQPIRLQSAWPNIYFDLGNNHEQGELRSPPLLLTMEQLHREELIAVGFPDGLLPRPPQVTYYVDHPNSEHPVFYSSGILTEIGNFAIREDLDPEIKEYLIETLFIRSVSDLFDPLSSPLNNVWGRILYTYGDILSLRMYSKMGFHAIDQKIMFNDKPAYILTATMPELLMGLLTKYPRLKQKLGVEFKEVIKLLSEEIPHLGPEDFVERRAQHTRFQENIAAMPTPDEFKQKLDEVFAQMSPAERDAFAERFRAALLAELKEIKEP